MAKRPKNGPTKARKTRMTLKMSGATKEYDLVRLKKGRAGRGKPKRFPEAPPPNFNPDVMLRPTLEAIGGNIEFNFSLEPNLNGGNLTAYLYQVALASDPNYVLPVFSGSQANRNPLDLGAVSNGSYIGRCRAQTDTGIGPWSPNSLPLTINVAPPPVGVVLSNLFVTAEGDQLDVSIDTNSDEFDLVAELVGTAITPETILAADVVIGTNVFPSVTSLPDDIYTVRVSQSTEFEEESFEINTTPPSVAPSFIVAGVLTPTDNLDGTVTMTWTQPTATGTAPIVYSRVVTYDGALLVVAGNTVDVDRLGDDAVFEVTWTAANGISPDATQVRNTTVLKPVITIDDMTFTAESGGSGPFIDITLTENTVEALTTSWATMPTGANPSVDDIVNGAGAALESGDFPYVTGNAAIATTAASDTATEIHAVVVDANGVASNIEKVTGLDLSTAPPAAPTFFYADSSSTAAAPTADTTVNYPGGGMVIEAVLKATTGPFELIGERDREDEFEVTVTPSSGTMRIMAGRVGDPDLTSTDSATATTGASSGQMAADANGFSTILVKYINDGTTTTSSTNRMESYVNGVAYDPDSKFFANTNWLSAGDNRGRKYTLLRDVGFDRGGEIQSIKLWYNPVTGSTAPAGVPVLEIRGATAGVFLSPHGGRYDIYDNGVKRTI